MEKRLLSRRPSACSSFLTTVGSASRKTTSLPDAAGDEISIATQTSTTGSADTARDPEDRRKLAFEEQNPFAPETVVLLHILFSCGLEWKPVLPKLPSYHLLIPDLPCHSGSRDVCSREDFSFELCADHIAELIRARAHDGRAHLVGISSGGFVAMEILRRHPDLVAGRSALVSGAWPYTGPRRAVASYPRLTYTALWSILHSPGYLFFKASGLSGDYHNDELLTEIKRNGSSRLARAASTLAWDEGRVREVARAGVRICFVAGDKGLESPDEARQCALHVRSEREGGELEQFETRAFVVRDAIHAWNLQHPSLFAKGIESWIERRPMPTEFESLL